jgi:hypothetical protein
MDAIKPTDATLHVTIESVIKEGASFGPIEFSGWVYEWNTDTLKRLGASRMIRGICVSGFNPFENYFSIPSQAPTIWTEYVHLLELMNAHHDEHQWEEKIVSFLQKVGFSFEEIEQGIRESIPALNIRMVQQ